MRHIMLGAAEMRELLTKSVVDLGRVRIELSQGAVDEAVRMLRDVTEPRE